MKKDYTGYEKMLNAVDPRITLKPSHQKSEVETFITSEDIAKAQLKKDERDSRSLSLHPDRIEETFFWDKPNPEDTTKYSEEEKLAFREGCRRVIVHDYGDKDFYHFTDDELTRNDQLAKISMKLGSLKRIYRSVDTYIQAMRIVFEAWSMLADSNPLHTRAEFLKYVAEGVIISNRIIMPRLKGINNYNHEMILEYISNPHLDPKDLLPKITLRDELGLADDDDLMIELERLLDPEEKEYLLEYDQHLKNQTADTLEVIPIKSKYLKSYDDQLTRKKKKKIPKKEKGVSESIGKMLKRIQINNYQKTVLGYSFGITENFFKEDKSKTPFERHRYQGSWQDDEIFHLYQLAMYEESLKEPVPEGYGLTYGDYELQKFFRILEHKGLNTVELRRRMNQSPENYVEVQKRKSRRTNKKIEVAISERIQRLNDNPKFKKLIKKAEKDFVEFNANQKEESDE